MTEHAYTTAAFRTLPAPRERQRHDVAAALGVAALCALALTLVWALVTHVPAVQSRDAVALYDFTKLSRPGIDSVANFFVHLLDPLEFAFWGLALVAIALARGRPRLALAVVAIMTLAPFTAERLKPLLAHPHDHIGAVYVGAASWPSGHSTAAAALALSAVLVSPPHLRRTVAIAGAAFCLLVGLCLLILAWHMPSDVLGGYLVAACWTALAVAALRASEHVRPTRRRSETAPAPAR